MYCKVFQNNLFERKCHQGILNSGNVRVLTSKQRVGGCYGVFSFDMASIYQAILGIVLQGILEERCVGASIAICFGVIEQAFKGLASICVLHVVTKGRGRGIVAKMRHEVVVVGQGTLRGAHQGGEGAGAGHSVHSAGGHWLLITLVNQRNLQKKTTNVNTLMNVTEL